MLLTSEVTEDVYVLKVYRKHQARHVREPSDSSVRQIRPDSGLKRRPISTKVLMGVALIISHGIGPPRRSFIKSKSIIVRATLLWN